jgi:hypothetical protein
VKAWDWEATCAVGITRRDCRGVAQLFVNNLARSGDALRARSGGVLTVEGRPTCPAETPDYYDASYCWQATAADVCMVIGRHNDLVVRSRFGFGQIGGDRFGSLLPQSDDPPCV